MIGSVNSGGAGGSQVVIQTTEPSDTSVLWINPTDNTLSYYNPTDGNWHKIAGVYA